MYSLTQKMYGRTTGSLNVTWLVTVSDLFLLLLTFFVLRFSLLTPSDQSSGIEQVNPVKSDITANHEANLVKLADGAANEEYNWETSLKHDLEANLITLRQSPISKAILDRGVRLNTDNEQIQLSLSPTIFQTETAALTFGGIELLSSIGKSLTRRPERFEIRIENRVPQSFYHSTAFASAWDLSRAQVLSVVRQLIDDGVEFKSISTSGYAGICQKKCNSIRNQNAEIVIYIRRSI